MWFNHQLQKPSPPANICLVSTVTRASPTIPSPQSDVLGQTTWALANVALLRTDACTRPSSASDIADQGTGRYSLPAVAGGHLGVIGRCQPEPVIRCYMFPELYTWCVRVCFLEAVLPLLLRVPFTIKSHGITKRHAANYVPKVLDS